MRNHASHYVCELALATTTATATKELGNCIAALHRTTQHGHDCERDPPPLCSNLSANNCGCGHALSSPRPQMFLNNTFPTGSNPRNNRKEMVAAVKCLAQLVSVDTALVRFVWASLCA